MQAHDHSRKLCEKATEGFYVLNVRERTLKVVKDEIEEFVPIDSVTPPKPSFDSVTFHPYGYDEASPKKPQVTTEKH